MAVVYNRSGIVLGTALVLFLTLSQTHAQSISIESWRVEDKTAWEEKILPAFEAANPGIFVNFEPTETGKYTDALYSRLKAGSAGDLITCRSFDKGLALYESGYLENLEELNDLANFSPLALVPWSTDAGDVTFCVPMASVLFAFIYNKDAFRELGLEAPETEEDFFAILDKIKNESSYLPLALGTADKWTSGFLGINNIGNAYWSGEKGRQALLSGKARMTDEPFVEAFRQLARWAPYLGDDYQSQSYNDSQLLFTFGRATIYPAGSWEIRGFQENSDFELGAFPPPKVDQDSPCYFGNNADMGIGMNPKTPNREAVMKFLEWTTTAEFAELLTNALPGFFSLSDHVIDVENNLANEFATMLSNCEGSTLITSQILSRGDPPLSGLLIEHSANVLDGSQTPEEAAAAIQEGLDSWYKP